MEALFSSFWLSKEHQPGDKATHLGALKAAQTHLMDLHLV
jgi:hypothetical protein